jgi:primary-amine oxidase
MYCGDCQVFFESSKWIHQEQAGIAGRPSRDLVLRAVATIGNYDYIFDWRFE